MKFKCRYTSCIEVDIDLPDGTYYDRRILEGELLKQYTSDEIKEMLYSKLQLVHFSKQ